MSKPLKKTEAETAMVAATETAAPVSQPRIAPQLVPQDIQPDGVKWSRWSVFAQAEHTIEDCLSPRYLFAKAEHIRPGDYIEIKHPFGHFVVCLDVVKVDHAARGLVAHIRHVFDYTEAESMVTPDLSGARVEFLGARQWAVVEGHHVVKDEFITRTAAEAWLAAQRRGE